VAAARAEPGVQRAGLAGPERVGGGGPTINVTVNGWVGNDQDLARRLQEALIRQGRWGGAPLFDGYA
jgi:hypothetical protein